MAKMFYTLEEAKNVLARSDEDIKQFAREGRLKFLADPAEVTVTKRAERAYEQRVRRDPRDLLKLALPWLR